MVVSEAKSSRVDTDRRGSEVLPFGCVSPFVRAVVHVRRRLCTLLFVRDAICVSLLMSAAVRVHCDLCTAPFVCAAVCVCGRSSVLLLAGAAVCVRCRSSAPHL
jgi:hypothetical protein